MVRSMDSIRKGNAHSEKNGLFVSSRAMYTEAVTSSMTKLYISETHNKHAGPYTCAALDQLQQPVAEKTIKLLLFSKIICTRLQFVYSRNAYCLTVASVLK